MKRKERVMVAVIDNEELPKAFPSLIRSTTLEAPDGWGERSFKELLERG